MTTDFPFFCSLFGFLSFSCSEFFILFCWCLWLFSVFAFKLQFSVVAFVLSVSLTITDVSSKSFSWVVFCCNSLWLESGQPWILSDVSWLLTLLHSTTSLSRFANCCSKDWLISSLFFNCSSKNVMSSCNCFIKSFEFSAKRSLPQEIECLILKESTSAENYDFRGSHSSNTES